MVTATLLYEVRADLGVIVHADVPPSDEEWDGWVDALVRGACRRVLVFTDSASPDSLQRARLNRITHQQGVPTAVVSGSAGVRSVVTIFRLFNPKIRAFAPNAIASAFDHLSVAQEEREAIHRCVSDLRLRLAGADPADPRIMTLGDTIAKLDALTRDRLPALRARIAATGHERTKP